LCLGEAKRHARLNGAVDPLIPHRDPKVENNLSSVFLASKSYQCRPSRFTIFAILFSSAMRFVVCSKYGMVLLPGFRTPAALARLSDVHGSSDRRAVSECAIGFHRMAKRHAR
jgi:hypothetical protein